MVVEYRVCHGLGLGFRQGQNTIASYCMWLPTEGYNRLGGWQLIKAENVLLVQDVAMTRVNWILLDMEYCIAYK